MIRFIFLRTRYRPDIWKRHDVLQVAYLCHVAALNVDLMKLLRVARLERNSSNIVVAVGTYGHGNAA